MMRIRWLTLACCLAGLLMTLAPAMAQDDGLVRQWANRAVASSEYSPTSWSASQATGAPDVNACRDDVAAWASATTSDRNEYLTVYFAQPVYPTQVNIYQTYNPGSITGIDLILADGGNNISVRNSADRGTPCPGVQTVNIEWENPQLVNGVTIYLDQRAIGDWNEIDAVELVGSLDPNRPVTQTITTTQQYVIEGDAGRSVTCEDGTSFSNGVEVRVIQMRTGFNYTATAIGLNGFDPVLAVLNEQGRGLCVDDNRTAAEYNALLPTTGFVPVSNVSSQVTFAHRGRTPFGDISLVVGGYGDSAGEFILILEGMALTSADGAGDMFSIQITPGMIASGIAPSVYMVSVTTRFDPLIALIDSELNFVRDNNGNFIACDDAGNVNSCWGESASLVGSFISRTQGRQLGGGASDAMLTLPVVPGNEWRFYNFLMRSFEMRTYGDYLVAFHIGIGR